MAVKIKRVIGNMVIKLGEYSKKLSICVFLTIIILFNLCACGNNQEQQDAIAKPGVMDGMEHLLDFNTMGYFFGVYPEPALGKIKLDKWSDPMQFFVESAGDDRQFAVYFFLDYKQVPITVNEETYEQYFVNVKGDYSNKFDFCLAEEPEPGKIHKFTGILTAYSDVLMAEQDNISFSSKDSIILNYDLYIDNVEELPEILSVETTPELLYDSQGAGILLNCYTDELSSRIPQKEIRVKKGENLTLQYHVGGYEKNDFALIVTAGYQQMNLEGQSYLYFKDLPSGQMAAGYLEMETPDVPGSYEIIGYVIPEPFSENGVSTQHSDSSYRFTLIVE